MLKRVICVLLRITLIPFFIREIIQRKKVTIILYHDIKADTVDRHFRVLQAKYNIISLRDYLAARTLREPNRLPPKALIITFDDGHRGNYELRPVLERYKIPVTIFLCSGIVGTNRHFWFRQNINNSRDKQWRKMAKVQRWEILMETGFEETKEFSDRMALCDDEIRDMINLVDFQSHTVFHPILPHCSDNRAQREIGESKKELESKYNIDIYALSYPNGDYSDRDIQIAKEMGYKCGVTVDLGFNSENSDLFRLKRICMDDEAGISELLVKASGLWEYIKRKLRSQY